MHSIVLGINCTMRVSWIPNSCSGIVYRGGVEHGREFCKFARCDKGWKRDCYIVTVEDVLLVSYSNTGLGSFIFWTENKDLATSVIIMQNCYI